MAAMMASPYPSRNLHHGAPEAYDHGAEEDHQEADGSYADQSELQEPTEDAWREILCVRPDIMRQYCCYKECETDPMSCSQAVFEMGNIMDASSELADIAAAEEAVRTKDEKRQDHVKGLWAEVDGKLSKFGRNLGKGNDDTTCLGLTDDLHKAREAAQRPANQPTSEEHRVEVDRLEQAYAQTGKQLKEEQAAVAKKEAELSRWKSEKEEVGKIEVGDEGENWADGKV